MSKYWQNRFEILENARNETAKQTIKSVTPAFGQAQAQIQKEINAWYARFANNNEITLQEAKKLLTTRELKEFRWDVQEYIKYGRENAIDQKWLKELENASSRFHISRLEALKIRTQNFAERAFGNEVDAVDELAAKIYMSDYYHTAYEIQRGLGIGWDVAKIDQRKLDNLISKPWTTDKQTFSDRIWKSKTQLIDSIHTELTQMCILGKAPDQVINNLAKRFDVSAHQAGRLIMTESAYFGSVAQKDAFDALDVEKYEIVATLDNRTSEVCQEMDGKVFDMKDFQAGVTAPPFHVFCRSCTAPWFEDDVDGERAARGEDGKTYQVPASMKYEDWKKTFVDGGSKDGLKVIDDVEELKKQLADKELELDGLKNKMKSIGDDHIEWKDGKNTTYYKKYNTMTDDELQKYSNNLKKQKSDLDDEYKKIEVDYERYFARPDRRTPEREEWDKWHEEIKSKYGVDSGADLFNNLMDIQNKQSTIRKELNEIENFLKWKTKFGSKTEQDFIDEIAELTFAQQDVQKQIDDLKEQIVAALKDRKVGDSFKEKIENLKEIIIAKNGTISEDDLKEAGKLFQEELLKNAQYSERIQKFDEANEQMKSTYAKYRYTQQEIVDLKKQHPEIAEVIDEYESMEWWVKRRPDHEEYARRFKEAKEKINQINPKYFELKDAENELHELYQKYSNAFYDLKKDFEYKNAEDVKNVLSQIRDMGSDGIDIKKHLCNSKSEVAKYVEQAYSYYPKDWVEKSVQHGTMKPKKVQRGYYGGSEIAISGSGSQAFTTSIHELGHRMEVIIPDIKKAEKVFYARRTAGEDLKWLGSGYRRDEKTRKDDFLHPYMGKDYGGSWYELVSMGFEYGYSDPAHLMKDPDMANWIYGILSLY